ncbi:DedA family protein [Rubrobacter tropicus]|uniref:DedA family protein n=1 Tax=Rubrobacter tropicus TaxID=2653851 RepID=A0A6G8QDA9_9ACTN|nr:VTT domain-containing protein [Rubrobacter tropicus]QIN84494.1 DedA family protein [Rubrobacter tropicus]
MSVLAHSGLFAWSFLAATALPLGSEAALAAAVGARGQLVGPLLVATAGNVLGACTTYWLGRKSSRVFGRRWEASAGEARAARLLRRHGGPALLLSPLPVLGDVLVALAGMTRVPFGAFVFWVTLGKGVRYAAVALAASTLW